MLSLSYLVSVERAGGRCSETGGALFRAPCVRQVVRPEWLRLASDANAYILPGQVNYLLERMLRQKFGKEKVRFIDCTER